MPSGCCLISEDWNQETLLPLCPCLCPRTNELLFDLEGTLFSSLLQAKAGSEEQHILLGDQGTVVGDEGLILEQGQCPSVLP